MISGVVRSPHPTSLAMQHELLNRELGCAGSAWALGSHPSLIRRLKPSNSLPMSCPVEAVSYSTDGNLLLTGGDDAVLKIWDLSRSQRPMLSIDTGKNYWHLQFHVNWVLSFTPCRETDLA